jgi:hypothetical protein
MTRVRWTRPVGRGLSFRAGLKRGVGGLAVYGRSVRDESVVGTGSVRVKSVVGTSVRAIGVLWAYDGWSKTATMLSHIRVSAAAEGSTRSQAATIVSFFIELIS